MRPVGGRHRAAEPARVGPVGAVLGPRPGCWGWPAPLGGSRSDRSRAPPLQEAWLLRRERELREETRRDRDKEIELVVHRLEADMTLAREESERASESR